MTATTVIAAGIISLLIFTALLISSVAEGRRLSKNYKQLKQQKS